MEDKPTRRSFLHRVVVGAGAAAVAAMGLTPMATSRPDLLNQLAQHLVKMGAQLTRYSKF